MSKRIYLSSSGVSIVGIILSSYLTNENAVVESGVCEIGRVFSCNSVLFSSYSKFLGVEVAYYGLAWFVVALILSLLAVNSLSASKILLLWSIVGIVGIVILNYVEIVLIGAICLLCLTTHILGAVVFSFAYVGFVGRRERNVI